MKKEELATEMNVIASTVMKTIRTSQISKEAATLAIAIGLISSIRVDCLNEDEILKLARRSVPRDRFQGPM